MQSNLIGDIDWQALIWSDTKRPTASRQNAETAFSDFPRGGKLDFIKNPEVWEFQGSQKFYRFGNPVAIMKFNDPGAWWVDEPTYQYYSQEAQRLGVTFPEHYRAAYAVSRDWSDLKNLYEMIVPANEKILGVLGETKYQPEHSITSSNQSNVVFFGRGRQIYFRAEDLQRFAYRLFKTF